MTFCTSAWYTERTQILKYQALLVFRSHTIQRITIIIMRQLCNAEMILLFCNNALFFYHKCVFNRGHNILTKFGDNRSNGRAQSNRNTSSNGDDDHVQFWLLSLFDSMYVFYNKVTISLLNLTLISQIVKKLQSFTKIQDVEVRHEFWQLAFSV